MNTIQALLRNLHRFNGPATVHTQEQTCGKVDLVLGAGGSRGMGHIGFLKFIEEKRVAVGVVTGVSIGSVVSTFWCNGFSAADIQRIMREETRHLPRFSIVLQMIARPAADPVRQTAGGHFDLVPFMRYLVEKYDLKPLANLQIMSCDLLTKRPCLFSGENYDLALAMAVSCSIPGVARPVHFQDMLLEDGGQYNMNPTEFCHNPAIVANLDRVRKLPRHYVSLIGLVSQFIEWKHAGRRSPLPADQPPNYVVVDGPPDVGTATFRLSARQYGRIIDFGYRAAAGKLTALIEDGLVPTRS